MNRITTFLLLGILTVLLSVSTVFAQGESQDFSVNTVEEVQHDSEKKFDISAMIMNHINDANEFHLFGNVSIPLPCILYSKDSGFDVFLSSKFDHGHYAVNRYVSYHGNVMRISDENFPKEKTNIGHVHYSDEGGNERYYVEHNGTEYEVEGASTLIGFTSFIDFSITKNVFTMLLVLVLMIWIFNGIADSYKQRVGLAPKGKQSLFEPIIQFVIDDIAKPLLGHKWMQYAPFLLTVFFFIWFLNILGLVPFFPGSANVTGNIGVTMTLAVITFLVVNISANKHYWKHIFWMPDVPVPMKIFLAPIEIIGIFTKPVSLMVRLFANITAGHIIILSLVGMIFVLGNAGQNFGGAMGGIGLAVPFAAFMNIIEVIVGFIQAFIFTILTASYIGSATEEAHH